MLIIFTGDFSPCCLLLKAVECLFLNGILMMMLKTNAIYNYTTLKLVIVYQPYA